MILDVDKLIVDCEKGDKLKTYEAIKKRLREYPLTPDTYERIIKHIVKKLRI